MGEVTSGWITREQVDAVTALLAELAEEGWSVGTSQIIATHNLLLALNANPRRELTTARLAEWLGPVICKSQKQQAEFPARLAAALKDLTPVEEPPPPPPPQRRLHVAVLLAVLGIAVLGTAAWIYVRMNRPANTVNIEQSQPGQTGGPPGQTGGPPANTTDTTGTATPGPAPQPAVTPQPATPLWPFVTGGLILAAVAAWFATGARREHRLRKVFAPDDEVRDYFPSIGTMPLIDLEFRRAAQVMRRRFHEPGTEVDVQATIEATAARAGAFSPVFAPRTRTPEYLVLIDQATTRDIQAMLFESVTRRLLAYGVAADLFFFDGDPRVCWKPGRNSERFRFETIASSYARHNLMIFTAAERFADRLTDRPARWVHSFFSWFRDPVLFTPRPVMQWDAMEWMLARAGALVLPATGAGIATYLARGERAPQVSFNAGGALIPQLLEEDEELWITPAEPPRELVRQLIRDLALALGPDAMTWLAACAIYPGVDWAVLLYLGKELQVANFEDNLLAIARLPWFRRGYMPDWLRMRLLWTLDKPQERRIRQALFAMFDQAVFEKSGGKVRLSHYRDLANAVGEGHELSEHVILDFMSGRKATPLHLSIPQRFALRVEEYLERYARHTNQVLHPQWATLLLAYLPFAGVFLARSRDEEVRWHARMGTLAWMSTGALTLLAYFLTVPQLLRGDSYAFPMKPILGLGFRLLWVLLLMPWLPVFVIAARRAAYGNRVRIPMLHHIADAPDRSFLKVLPYSLLARSDRLTWREWGFLAGIIVVTGCGWSLSWSVTGTVTAVLAWLYACRALGSWLVLDGALTGPARLVLAAAAGALFAVVASRPIDDDLVFFKLPFVAALVIGGLLGDLLRNRRMVAVFGMAWLGFGAVWIVLEHLYVRTPMKWIATSGETIMLAGAALAWPAMATIFGRPAGAGPVSDEVRRAVSLTPAAFVIGLVAVFLVSMDNIDWLVVALAEVAILALAHRAAPPDKQLTTALSPLLLVWSVVLILAATGLTEWLRLAQAGYRRFRLEEDWVLLVAGLGAIFIYRRKTAVWRVAFAASVAVVAMVYGNFKGFDKPLEIAFSVSAIAVTSAAWLAVQFAPFRWRGTTAMLISVGPLILLAAPYGRAWVTENSPSLGTVVSTAVVIAILAVITARKTREA